jgi:hypothetical protein
MGGNKIVDKIFKFRKTVRYLRYKCLAHFIKRLLNNNKNKSFEKQLYFCYDYPIVSDNAIFGNDNIIDYDVTD